MSIYSCDTMVALGNSTKSGNVIFAKNSDRPITEPQPLIVYEAQDHENNTTVKCTYIEIPQVEHTYKVMGSTPYWIWGFEHGINEHNVIIGNEAVWARQDVEQQNGLLGMDLLRLGLERGKTAYEALHVITDLLEKHGQGGNAAVGMEHKYNNLFLIADKNEAWILETFRRKWVAKKVKDVAGISNCYSIEEEWDEDSGDVKEYAYEQGFISKDVPFNWAKAYTVMSVKHRAAHPRFMRLNKLLNANKGDITIDTMRTIQRDHFEGEIIEPRWSPADGLHVSICMHAMTDTASKTAAATHVELKKEGDVIIWNAFACPCLSIFAPFTMNTILPKCVSYAKEKFEEESLWWKFERLQYAIEQDYPLFKPMWREKADPLENEFKKQCENGVLPTQQQVDENTTKMIALVDEMYNIICKQNITSNQCQHTDMNELAKTRAGIIF